MRDEPIEAEAAVTPEPEVAPDEDADENLTDGNLTDEGLIQGNLTDGGRAR